MRARYKYVVSKYEIEDISGTLFYSNNKFILQTNKSIGI